MSSDISHHHQILAQANHPRTGLITERRFPPAEYRRVRKSRPGPRRGGFSMGVAACPMPSNRIWVNE